MPSPVGHMLAGLFLARVHSQRTGWRGIRIFILAPILAAASDLDLLLIFTGMDYFDAHRTYTHSVFTLLVALIIFIIVDRVLLRNINRTPIPCFLVAALLYSHILLDLLSLDTYGPRGLMLFWPLSEGFHELPIGIFLGPRYPDGTIRPALEILFVLVREIGVITLMGILLLLAFRFSGTGKESGPFKES